MNVLSLIGAATLFVLMLSGCGGTTSDGKEEVPWSRPMILGAHRGGGGEWPESTLLAFRNAAERFPDILLEGDLQLSKDGVVVVIHDKDVDRTTNGSGPVKAFTLAELKALDAGYTFTRDGGATFPYRGQGITIPTLEEVLAVIPEGRVLFELKDGEGLVDAVVPIIQAHGATERLLMASFNPEFMSQLRSALSDVATCFDVPGAMALLSALRQGDWAGYTPTARMLSIPKRYASQFSLTGEEVGRLQEKGILVQVHTLNTEEDFTHYLAMGVDSILTDFPSDLATFLEARKGGERTDGPSVVQPGSEDDQ